MLFYTSVLNSITIGPFYEHCSGTYMYTYNFGRHVECIVPPQVVVQFAFWHFFYLVRHK